MISVLIIPIVITALIMGEPAGITRTWEEALHPDEKSRMQTARFDLDEKLLQEIADLTGGKYFRAGDTETLVKVYATIDELEKTKMEVTTFDEREDQYAMFAWPALAFLLAELLFGVTRFRRVP